MIRARIVGAALRLALLLSAAPAAAQVLTLRALTPAGGGRARAVDLATLPRARLALRDPTDGGRARTLAGPRLASVLAALPAPPDADTLAVRCDDGWLSLLPLSAVSRYHDAIVAVAESGRPLAPPRGPAFLAFPNLDAKAAARDPAIADNGYAWAVAALEYVRLADLLSPTEPPRSAPARVVRGGALFRAHCLHCHAVAGAGGLAGWDLARPALFRYRDERRVRAYVASPRTENPDAHMPAFGRRLSASDRDAILDYLRAMGH